MRGARSAPRRKRAEEKRYFLRASGNLYDLGRLMLNQGRRPEELLSLHCSDADPGKRTLRIKRGETEAARRTLNLTSESRSNLARRIAPGREWVFPSPKHPWRHTARLNNSHDAVLKKTGLNLVCTISGTPLRDPYGLDGLPARDPGGNPGPFAAFHPNHFPLRPPDTGRATQRHAALWPYHHPAAGREADVSGFSSLLRFLLQARAGTSGNLRGCAK